MRARWTGLCFISSQNNLDVDTAGCARCLESVSAWKDIHLKLIFTISWIISADNEMKRLWVWIWMGQYEITRARRFHAGFSFVLSLLRLLSSFVWNRISHTFSKHHIWLRQRRIFCVCGHHGWLGFFVLFYFVFVLLVLPVWPVISPSPVSLRGFCFTFHRALSFDAIILNFILTPPSKQDAHPGLKVERL